MMAQYLEVKERHNEYLLFYRMGDFYELFFDDAKIAASHLGIALTKRGKINNQDIPMCGVPVHASQTYLSRLIKLGFKVAIAEQLEEKSLKSGDKKTSKIFKRDVVRIITPGTILEDSLLESKSYNYLLSISFFKGEISLAWVDMTTGSIKLQRVEGVNFKDDLLECINKVEPGEIIVSNDLVKFNTIKEKLKSFEKVTTQIPNSFYDIQNNKEKIKTFFKNSKIDYSHNLSENDISVIGALINYLELTQKKNLPKIKNFEIIDKNNFMQIDMFSEKSLEIFQKTNGEKKGSLLDVIDKTKTSSGGRLLRDFLKNPLIKINEIKNRHDLVEKFILNLDLLKRTLLLLSSLPDVERALSRISAKTNNPRDLIMLALFVEKSIELFAELKGSNDRIIKKLIIDHKIQFTALRVGKLIRKKIQETPPINLNDGGVIRSGVDKRLDDLRNIKNLKQNDILDLQSEYALETGVNNLKIKFNNFHGYFVETTNKNTDKLKDCSKIDFRLIQNTINTSRFQTEKLKKISLDIENSESESVELEMKIYENICRQIGDESDCINLISHTVSFIDVISNFAILSLERKYTKPNLVQAVSIDIQKGRHPVVEESLKKEGQEFTPNDCVMDGKNNTWIMTGPNMAGKSTFLRQIAIIVILNQIGCFVPSSSANLSVFDKIFTRIGASDNLSEGLSTFMTEMIETSRIIDGATNSSLVILDELGRGTSTEDGLAISRAVLEFIIQKIKCITLFATHFKEICQLEKKYDEIKLKTLAIKRWNDEIIFLYKVVDGISEGSFGIHVANLAGINNSILSRAKEILKQIKQDENFVLLNEKDVNFDEKDAQEFNEIVDEIKKLDLDNLSPKESLDILYTIKKNYLS